jgi:hypothetical protein
VEASPGEGSTPLYLKVFWVEDSDLHFLGVRCARGQRQYKKIGLLRMATLGVQDPTPKQLLPTLEPGTTLSGVGWRLKAQKRGGHQSRLSWGEGPAPKLAVKAAPQICC